MDRLVSYDLAFWQQELNAKVDPEVTLDQLADGNHVEGLTDIPVEDILARLCELFPTAVRELNGGEEWLVWVSQNQQDSFQVMWSAQHCLVNCRHLANEDINAIISVMTSRGCPLYDPQTGERFAFDGL